MPQPASASDATASTIKLADRDMCFPLRSHYFDTMNVALA
jgi:hypothetical protein